eukprot:TRINITY_DN19099_c1_g5_i1.p1 TRINITY_DN19099_c1_g5~~TRINITY_DN19099_c1_g5_i1.p1  ORF type:complete len:438 (+),score=123.69 TRINITY_DN19099_c1_g5_i1:71-1315(+)
MAHQSPRRSRGDCPLPTRSSPPPATPHSYTAVQTLLSPTQVHRLSFGEMAELRGLLEENGRLLQVMDGCARAQDSPGSPPRAPEQERPSGTPPLCLRVHCPDDAHVAGLYTLLQTVHNCNHVWGCGAARIYASNSGLWMITNSVGDMPLSSGFLCSAQLIGRRWPHEMLDWQVYNGSTWLPTGSPVVSVARVEPVHVRPARPGDVDFLTWAVAAAERSHLNIGAGALDCCLPRLTEEEKAALLRDVIAPPSARCRPHAGSWDAFLVAEVGGEVVGCLSRYASDERSCGVMFAEMAARLDAQGRRAEAETLRVLREEIAPACAPPSLPAPTWCLEFVAVRGDQRRRGAGAQLVAAALREGRCKGYTTAEVAAMVGNEAALRLYHQAGFREFCTVSCPGWRRHIPCAGVVHLRTAL